MSVVKKFKYGSLSFFDLVVELLSQLFRRFQSLGEDRANLQKPDV